MILIYADCQYCFRLTVSDNLLTNCAQISVPQQNMLRMVWACNFMVAGWV